MHIVYIDHAKKRMKERGLSETEVEHVLAFPSYAKKSVFGRWEAAGQVNERQIKVIFEKEKFEKENYIKIITVM